MQIHVWLLLVCAGCLVFYSLFDLQVYFRTLFPSGWVANDLSSPIGSTDVLDGRSVYFWGALVTSSCILWGHTLCQFHLVCSSRLLALCRVARDDYTNVRFIWHARMMTAQCWYVRHSCDACSGAFLSPLYPLRPKCEGRGVQLSGVSYCYSYCYVLCDFLNLCQA